LSRSLRPVLREASAAIAVLSIYMLTLLIPLHQSAASQRGFAALGYEAPGVWSICTTVNDAGSDADTGGVGKCPVSGIGKGSLLAAGGAAVAAPFTSVAVDNAALSGGVPAGRRDPATYPRAPPAAV
jgi:hypothetical protein